MTSTPNQDSPLDPTTQASTLRSLLDTLPHRPAVTPAEIELSRQAAAISLAALHPRDPAEAMLAARYVALHYAMMDVFRRAAQPNLPDAMVLRILGRAVSLGRLVEKAGLALTLSQKRKPAQAVALPVADVRAETVVETVLPVPDAPPVAAQAAEPEPAMEQPAGTRVPAPAGTHKDPVQHAPAATPQLTGAAIVARRPAARGKLRASLAASTSFGALLGRPPQSPPAVQMLATCPA